ISHSCEVSQRPEWRQQPPIGKPIANVRGYVLDAQQQMLGVGLIGELYLSGAGLARGYLKQPQLTAERFLPNPFGGTGERLYRTGDRCRYLQDGTLQLLGRVDEQVKVRGYRIELGEVEWAVKQHPQVSEAAAVVAGGSGGGGEARVICYV